MQNSLSSNSSNNSLQSPLKQALGEILVEAGLISPAQIELALQEQKHQNLKIGEILASHGWIKQETADFFAEKWVPLLQQKEKQPLVYYFREAGLLSEEQIKLIVKEQKNRKNKKRFHHLVLEKGYLKPITVEFFLISIFSVYSSQKLSFSKPYEMLREYIKGKTNFTKIDFRKATFKGLTLKAVTLDGSNLRGTDLSSCNLTNSSMVRVNLAEANLTKTILTGVNFERSLIVKADFRKAHLVQTNFKDASLQGSDFSDAYLLKASFVGADLRGAKFSAEYPYEVYYDKHTRFDRNFQPELRGWKQNSCENPI